MRAQALGSLLKQTHRGYFIPPRPEKNAVEGQRGSPDFVEQRRLALERWLQQLASHPVIGASDVSPTLPVKPSFIIFKARSLHRVTCETSFAFLDISNHFIMLLHLSHCPSLPPKSHVDRGVTA